MHQLYQRPEYLDVGFQGLDRSALSKFHKTYAKRPTYMRMQVKKIREPQIIIIRNKYTKEIVDLEVKL